MKPDADLNRISERTPHGLSERSGDPATGAAGLASEFKSIKNPYSRSFPRLVGENRKSRLSGAAGSFKLLIDPDAVNIKDAAASLRESKWIRFSGFMRFPAEQSGRQ